MTGAIQGHDTSILRKLRLAFSRHRRRHGRAYSENLRRLAGNARKHGHSVVEVATAAGISEQCFRNWLKNMKTEPGPVPIELKLIDQPRVTETAQLSAETCDNSLVCIRFRSGAILELPISRLDSGIVAALNESAL